MRLKVKDGYQIQHGEKLLKAGDEFECSEQVAKELADVADVVAEEKSEVEGEK